MTTGTPPQRITCAARSRNRRLTGARRDTTPTPTVVAHLRRNIAGWIAPISLAIALVAPHRVTAQSARAIPAAHGGIAVGRDLDEYLRYLESLGRTPLEPWGLRAFSPPVVDSLTAVHGAHPWATSWMFARDTAPRHLRVLPLDVTERFNSAYPYGINDGPVWAGRGLTSSVAAGFAFAAGPFSAVVNPVLFRAENTASAVRPNGRPPGQELLDAFWPIDVDRPQRFGTSAYTHFDPGETTLRLDMLGFSLGATTANEWWGPATTFPYIVGNNAAGVPRVFVGTEHPTNVYIGTIQARVEYGIELQSAFSPVVGPDTYLSPDSSGRRRFMSALAVTFSPAIFPGLEIDAQRYFHQAWRGRVGATELGSPFQGLLKSSIAKGVVIPGVDDRDALKNQLAAIGFRWVLPHGGFDFYGEYGREDYAENKRAIEVQPDLTRTVTVGFRKAFTHADSTSIDALRAEVYDANPTTMGLYRPEGHNYIHFPLRQGHTEEGQLIGAAAGVGAPAAAILAWDRYGRDGRTTLFAQKMSENTPSDRPSAPVTTGTLGVDQMRFTRFGALTWGAAAVRATRVTGGWGGWNLAANVGMVLVR